MSKLLLGVVPPWLSSVFHLGGHRHIQKAADHHRAEQYVRKVLQHLFLPRDGNGILLLCDRR